MTSVLSRAVHRQPARAMTRALVAVACLATLGGCSLFSKENKHPPAELKPVSGTLSVRQAWKADVGKSGPYSMQPAAAGNNVYVSSNNGNVMALEGASGRVLWKAKADLDLTSGPGSDGSVTAVAGEKGAIYAFDASGKQIWKKQVNGEVLSAPLVGNGLVVVRTTDTRVFGLDAETGERRWIYQRSQTPLNLRASMGMVFAGDGIVMGFPGGKLGVLTPGNGVLRWESAVSYPKGVSEIERLNDVTGLPMVSGRQVCATTFQGRVACLELASGQPQWGKDFSSPSGPAQDDNAIYASDEQSVVHAFDRQNGNERWKNNDLRNRRLGAPLALGRSVVMGDFEGYVHFLSREDGQVIARMKTDGSAITAAPVMAGQTMVIQTRDGDVYGFQPG
ncbi:outer membrane protein assembly factor BamB [Cupriavidus necator]|jgi:outer membrane protein assembly factor BamB|uniref:Outer membrane protein assembly factor BamB n=2 Tax=Cupriavidus necator TaxID=106590 RepID=G0F0H5_CUPNN|nr:MULTISPECIES: outer membrane protein assembly factor BamB [Cupriavidus]AEI77604.1 lipoprotein YfgL [Cupriavidus necator N-1]KAI3598291.1 Outer membrane beta-barrel assembly protein BamB [Cupriavidus necator H850]MDX6013861.1 outer membrane protein assembly factor BamB [Cupriavidus necator]QQX83138.1 outer membrane protein assembly factor BamB [Cupriavidus necator]QUN27076.1 outer membrane protein assembly factor BamB [Cupriavidus sp. KK10]